MGTLTPTTQVLGHVNLIHNTLDMMVLETWVAPNPKIII